MNDDTMRNDRKILSLVPVPHCPLLALTLPLLCPVELYEPPSIPQTIKDILSYPIPRLINIETIRNHLPLSTNPISRSIKVPNFLTHSHFDNPIFSIPLFPRPKDMRLGIEG